MPRSITVNVMARIQKDIRPKLITWDDFALSLVIALCIGALFVTAQSLPPILVAKIRVQGILLYQDILVNIRWLVPAMFFGFASFACRPYHFHLNQNDRGPQTMIVPVHGLSSNPIFAGYD
ncbi:MAG: hypothetical protein IPL71_20230 [Anaerolineales bacterium]|uniref:hypothetical protein n=1 Tax=Candidatus Villigracilis proximus TaxID=3140683 RepID=UPI0031374E62|nr:hypothetical protein [Anaerolineales bacterium]